MNDIAKKMDAILAKYDHPEVVKESHLDWEPVFYVFWFKELSEWCVGVTYEGFEWRLECKPLAVFPEIEVASAFACIVNQCGLAWLMSNRFSVEVNFPGLEVVE